MIDNNVGKGDLQLVNAVYAEKAAYCTLNGDRGVKVDKVLGVLGDAARGCSGLVNQLGIEVEF